jgi:vacuolar-type H+-ATPase subunit H
MTNRRPADAVQQIREHELEVAQSIEAARTAAEETVSAARVEARTIVEAARRKGREAARARYEEKVAVAQEAAAQTRDGAELAIRRLQQDAAPFVEEAVDAMVQLLLAPPEEESA